MMNIRKTLLQNLALIAIACSFGCNTASYQPAPSVSTMTQDAQTQLKQRLDQAHLTPDEQVEQQRELNRQMQSTAALRQLSQQVHSGGN
jgi:hypothetical protein